VIDVALFWQQWKVPSDLLDEIAAAIVAEGRRVLEPRASG
jgi:LysR family transcriptional regulator (chromosome initiation inhibitor)